jgi:ubiquinone/menaquinone biosynthesis C-methylase UbiE
MFSVKYWSDIFYPTPMSRDPSVKFLKLLSEHITKTSVILDLGAGTGELNIHNLKGQQRVIYGIDLDPRISENHSLDLGVIGDGNSLPFKSKSFDIIFCIYVLEHVENPTAFAKEIRRVLKPGGKFFALTPNKYHYVPLIAKITPTWFHKKLNQLRGRASEDTFPTFYKLNSEKSLQRHFSNKLGFTNLVLSFVEVRPNYLLFTLPTFIIGMLYERITNSTNLLSKLRVNIIYAVTRCD